MTSSPENGERNHGKVEEDVHSLKLTVHDLRQMVTRLERRIEKLERKGI
jgi:ubiquinone biosynthesis protein UbiJ